MLRFRDCQGLFVAASTHVFLLCAGAGLASGSTSLEVTFIFKKQSSLTI
jgi:hypothetical protein